MVEDPVLNELLERACPSIQYRLRLELLNQPRSAVPMLDLQRQILNDPAVQEVFSWQQPDGWLAWDFHGYQSTEAGIRLLCEKGVDPGHPVLAGALQALARETGRLARGIGKVGMILDQRGLGGSQTIRAALFACAGSEDRPCVKEQITQALAAFWALLAADDPGELFETYKDKTVIRPGILWPSIYHLRLLALTHSWRTPENRATVAESVRRLVCWSPLPNYYVRHKSQLLAPASFCMHDFNPELASLDSAHWMMWFQRMELLARLGVVHWIPELEQQVGMLKEELAAGQGRFTKPLAHPYFRKWGAYTGLMLETDWRDPRRRIYDLTFRSLLILHYPEKWSQPGA